VITKSVTTGLAWLIAANGTRPSLQLIDPTLIQRVQRCKSAAVGTAGSPAAVTCQRYRHQPPVRFLPLPHLRAMHIDDLGLVAGSVPNVA
jgi:hypothetical protein